MKKLSLDKKILQCIAKNKYWCSGGVVYLQLPVAYHNEFKLMFGEDIFHRSWASAEPTIIIKTNDFMNVVEKILEGKE